MNNLMVVRSGLRRILGTGLLAASVTLAQPAKPPVPGAPATSALMSVDQPDAPRIRDEFRALLDHYPPTLRTVFTVDHSLLSNETYLAPYPALASFLNTHPEIARSPGYYVGNDFRHDETTPSQRMWERMMDGLAVFAGFAMAIGLLTWLIRTLVDYRRWNRLTRVQTDVHTKILDRFTGHEELLNYIKSPAGSKFLESSPIALDAGPRSVGAPLGRILFSVQAGLVLTAGGIGLDIIGTRIPDDGAQPVFAMAILGISLGLGLVISAGVSYLISHRLGLIELASPPRIEPQEPLR